MHCKIKLLLMLMLLVSACSSLQPHNMGWSFTNKAQLIKGNHASLISKLYDKCDFQFCHDKSLAEIWVLVAEWISLYLDANPTANPDDLIKIANELDPLKTRGGINGVDTSPIDGNAISIQDGIYVIAVQYGEIGTVFIIARDKNGKHHLAWSLNDFSRNSTTQKSLFTCWNIESTCGPMYGSVTKLPSTAIGNPRFYIDANHAANGMTIGAQTSIWEWNGTTANPLLADNHLIMIDDGREVKTTGDIMSFPTKEQAKWFYSTGPELTPAGSWSVKVAPNGVEDLGHKWDEPELEFLDQIIDHLKSKKKSTDLASSSVLKTLLPLASLDREMLIDHNVIKKQGFTTLKATLEEYYVEIDFIMNGEHIFATNAWLKTNSCEQDQKGR